MNALRIVEFSGVRGLGELEAGWRSLTQSLPHRAFHHAFETHAAYATHVQTEMSYFGLFDGDTLRGIVPLEAGTTRALGRTATTWSLPFSSRNLHADIICAPDKAVRAAVLPLLLQHLRERSGPTPPWLHLDRLRSDSTAWECAQQLPASMIVVQASTSMDEIDCTQPYDAMHAARSRNMRHELRQATRRLNTYDRVRFESMRTVDSPEALQTMIDLEASGWKGREGSSTAIAFVPPLAAFVREISRAMTGPDVCDINMLHANGDCIAAQLCVRTGAEYVIYKIAYNEDYAHAAPGNLLLDWTIKRCCDDPSIQRISLMNDAAWHNRWKPSRLPVHSVLVGIPQWTGTLMSTLLRWRLQLAGKTT